MLGGAWSATRSPPGNRRPRIYTGIRDQGEPEACRPPARSAHALRLGLRRASCVCRDAEAFHRMPKTPETASVDEMGTVPLLRSRLRIAGGSLQPTVHSMQGGPVPAMRVAPGGAEGRFRRASVRPAHAMRLGVRGEAHRDRDAPRISRIARGGHRVSARVPSAFGFDFQRKRRPNDASPGRHRRPIGQSHHRGQPRSYGFRDRRLTGVMAPITLVRALYE